MEENSDESFFYKLGSLYSTMYDTVSEFFLHQAEKAMNYKEENDKEKEYLDSEISQLNETKNLNGLITEIHQIQQHYNTIYLKSAKDKLRIYLFSSLYVDLTSIQELVTYDNHSEISSLSLDEVKEQIIDECSKLNKELKKVFLHIIKARTEEHVTLH